ncbi:MAG TPA: ankyrin repeat domain-containing protein [Planctomicrobium sp.]|nr:ankyrin repeat domain-containing protein [Planctomicrobium sp.]
MTVRFVASGGNYNTQGSMVAARKREPNAIETAPDKLGWLYWNGLSPQEYSCQIEAPGYVSQSRPVLANSTEIANLGVVYLKKPIPVTVEYVVQEYGSFRMENKKQLECFGNSRRNIGEGKSSWQLQFHQQNGHVYARASSGSSHLSDLGAGSLETAVHLIYPDRGCELINRLMVRNQHIYSFTTHESWGDNKKRALLKLSWPEKECSSSDLRNRIRISHRIPVQLTAAPDVNNLNEQGTAQLHYAAMTGHEYRIRKLIGLGADVNLPQKTSRQIPLHYAAYSGDLKCVQLLIDNGARIDARSDWDITPLMSATIRGHEWVVKELLAQGAGINQADKRGWTPLHFAIQDRHLEAAQVLIDHGASLFMKNQNGKTPIDLNPDLPLTVPWKLLKTTD